MSIKIIEGVPGSGKSCYGVQKIKIDLFKSDRPIVTNLPIYIDMICLDVLKKKFKKNCILYDAELEELLSRFIVFIDMNNEAFMVDFIKKNPRFYSLNQRIKSFNNSCIDSSSWKKELIQPVENLPFFWRYIKENSYIYLDEVYEFFTKEQVKFNYNTAELLQEFQMYLRQHRHSGDDLFFITQHVKDLDPFILRCLEMRYEICNSLNQTMIDDKICEKKLLLRAFKGLRYVNQFFIIKEYLQLENFPQQKYTVFPNPRIFEFYDSFSRPKTLENEYQEIKSSDQFNQSKMTLYLNWIWKSKINLIVLFIQCCIGIGLMFVPFILLNIVKGNPVSSKNYKKKSKKVKATKEKIEVKKNIVVADQTFYIDYKSNNKLVSKGIKYGVGDKLQDKIIKGFNNEKIIFNDNSSIDYKYNR